MRAHCRVLLCRLLGHRPPQNRVGSVRGQFVRVAACPRCYFVFSAEFGARRRRRADWRDRLRAG